MMVTGCLAINGVCTHRINFFSPTVVIILILSVLPIIVYDEFDYPSYTRNYLFSTMLVHGAL